MTFYDKIGYQCALVFTEGCHIQSDTKKHMYNRDVRHNKAEQKVILTSNWYQNDSEIMIKSHFLINHDSF